MKIKNYIPDSITSLNLLSGVLGIVAVFEGRFDLAFYLMLAAACFDFCDGFSARLLKAYSDMGKELDSLADMVSFGILPSVMLCQFMRISTFSDSPICFVPLLIAVFSGLRLARYNVIKDNDGMFTGLTTPASAMICGSLCYYVATNPYSFLAVWAGGQVFIPVLSVVLSALLISKLPTFSLKMHRWDPVSLTRTRICFAVCVAICGTFVVLMKLNWSLVVLSSFIVYICLNITIFVFEKRPVVYFTRELSAEGLIRAYEMVNGAIGGKVGVKLHTGEQNGPNIIPREWVKALMAKDLPDASIIETNTYYEGDRYTTELHRQTLEVNGWTFCPVDIMDEEGTTTLPVRGKWFDRMSVGSHLPSYDSMVALTHFKGHTCAGFGGSNKNIGIGCADGRIGKAWIHTVPGSDNQWGIVEEEFMERMTESTKATIDHFGPHVTYVNVMRNMSVSCDCEGLAAEPVVTPDVGILSSTDILAIDQACVDIIYAMKEEERHAMVERIETRHGLRQLSYMRELGMGSRRYILRDLDNGGRRICPRDAARDLKPFVSPEE